jgi:zinc transporter, ZIP family
MARNVRRDPVNAPARRTRGRLLRTIAAGVTPLLMVGLMVSWFLKDGVAILRLGRAPIEKLAIERVLFRPQEIVLLVRNVGPAAMSIGQVLVNDALWDFSIAPARDLPRLGAARISLPYDWIEGDPYDFTIVSGTGLRHSRTVEVATATPAVSPRALATFGLLGAYVGLVPVLLGLLWLPFLRSMPPRWMDFWLSLTLGLLLFLGIDTLKEALAILGRVPEFLNGLMLIAAGAIGAFLGLFALDRGLTRGAGGARAGLGLATLIAIGIGLHNLGEGLAIGAAYTLGEVALGSFLIVGFTLHNTTEGLAILSPLVSERIRVSQLALLGLVAGAPTIAGTWTGAFTYSDPLSLLFLGIGSGAIFQVVHVLVRARIRGAESPVEALARPRVFAGILAGFLALYATSLLIGS